MQPESGGQCQDARGGVEQPVAAVAEPHEGKGDKRDAAADEADLRGQGQINGRLLAQKLEEEREEQELEGKEVERQGEGRGG